MQAERDLLRETVQLPVPGARAWSDDRVYRARRAFKRGLDVAISVVGLVLAAPLLLVVAIAIKATTPGPALFLQTRVGRGGRPFRICKFRTMVADAEVRLRADPEMWASYVENHFKLPAWQDPRLTALGRFLRRTSLDELPQLFNVLRGDMALVGPRPVVPAELETFAVVRSAYKQVRPGITGYWQVCGRSAVTGIDRLALDVYYAENWSLRLDLSILLRTLPAVIRGNGAH